MSKKYLIAGLLLVLALSVTMLLSRAGWLEMAENLYYDFWHQLAGVRYSPNQVAIVAIDARTDLEHKDEPLAFWGPYFAQAIQVLRRCEVKVIGLDFLYMVSAEAWLKRMGVAGDDTSRYYDSSLREQLNAGQVVLAGELLAAAGGQIEKRWPPLDFLRALPPEGSHVGFTNFYPDPDGLIRRFVPALLDKEGNTLVGSFAYQLTQRAGKVAELSGKEQPLLYINFAGPPRTFRRISFRDLLQPEAEQNPEIRRLKDKVVIIASETGHDAYLTPYARGFFGWKPDMMSGAEIHANIVETLLTGRFLRSVPLFVTIGYLLVIIMVGVLVFFRLSPLYGAGAFFLLATGAAGIAFFSFLNRWLLPVAEVQLALLLVYLGTLGLRLTGEERARQHLRQIFGRYVSEKVVEKILASGNQPDLGGEALQVTVLFSDIRGFTAISESLSPHEVVELLNAYFSRVCEPILEQGGTVDKFIGDAVMAVFGAPAPFADHALRALKVALAIAEQAQKFQSWLDARFPGRLPREFDIGIGIHTGEAVLGNIGSDQRMEFTSIGDTVNLASRLEGLTKELGWKIIASGDTIQAAGPGIVTGRHGEIQVRGRQKVSQIFEVVGLEAK